MVHRFVLEGYNEIAGTLVNHHFRNSGAVEILICEDLFNGSFRVFDVEVKKNGTYIQEIIPSSEEIKNCYDFENEEEADSYLKRMKESYWRSNVNEFHFDIMGIDLELYLFLFCEEDEISLVSDTSSILQGILQKLFLTKGEEYKIRELYMLPMVIKELYDHVERRKSVMKGKRKDKKGFNKSKIIRNARLAYRGLNEIGRINEDFRECKLKMVETDIQYPKLPDFEIILEAKKINSEHPLVFLTCDNLQYTLAEICGLKAVYIPSVPSINSRIRLNKENVGRLLYELTIDFGQIEVKNRNIRIRLQSEWTGKDPDSWREVRLRAETIGKNEQYCWEIFREVFNSFRDKYEKIEEIDPRFEDIYF